jgi:glycerol-3-phosphate dehydrogenase
VLQQSQSSRPSEISRDWVLKTSPNGLISSIGGKLTSAREDAATMVDTLCKRLGITAACQTFNRTFPWLTGTDYQTLLDNSLAKAKQIGIDNESALWLVKRHGNRVNVIFQLCEDNRNLTQRIKPELPFIMADLVFCAQHEMVIHLDDLLRRRVPLLILARLSPEELQNIAKISAEILAWDNIKTLAELARCR